MIHETSLKYKKSSVTAPLKWSKSTKIPICLKCLEEHTSLFQGYRYPDLDPERVDRLDRNELKGRIRIWNWSFRISPNEALPGDDVVARNHFPVQKTKSLQLELGQVVPTVRLRQRNKTVPLSITAHSWSTGLYFLVHPSRNFVNYVLDKMLRRNRRNSWVVPAEFRRIPAIPRNRKLSEFRSKPFRGREKCSEFRFVWQK